MADDIRRDEQDEQDPDLGSRREFDAADVARANEPRTSGEPATGEREPQEPPSTHTRDGGAPHHVDRGGARGEDRSFLGRAREAWDRIRNRT